MDADSITRKVVAEELVKKHERFLESENKELTQKESEESELLKIIENAKKKRDELNEKVATLKEKRTKLHEEIKELRKGFFDLIEKEGELRKETSGIGELKKRIDSLEWDIMTKAVTLDKERELIEEIKQVYSKINEKSTAIEQKTDIRKRIKDISISIGAKFSEAQKVHEEVVKLAAESQMYHEIWYENTKKYDEIHERIRTLKRYIINHEAARNHWLGKVQEYTVSLAKAEDKAPNEKKEEKETNQTQKAAVNNG